MAVKISKRTRESAAKLCSMAACSDGRHRMYAIAANLRYPVLGAARQLAFAALAEVNDKLHPGVGANRYAEAEALIRNGWTPRGAW